MAALPPDSTGRVRIKYSVAGRNHTTQIRYGLGATPDEVVTDFNAFVTALSAYMLGSTFVSATHAVSGSNVFNPFEGEWPVGWGGAAGTADMSANMVDFIGRGLSGHRVRVTMFGTSNESHNGLFRVPAADNAIIANAVQVLRNAEGTYLDINGGQPLWEAYANLGPNAYWRNKIR